MMDGQVVLGDPDVTYRLFEMYQGLPQSVLDEVYGVFTSLMKRMGEASNTIEAYLYESESRFLWISEGDSILQRGHQGPLGFTGWNPIQKLWAYYNRSEDEREAHDLQWQLAIFQVGPHAPKGIKKVESKNRKHQADIEKKRQDVMDRVYYEGIGLIQRTKEKQRKGPWQEVTAAHTPEELKEEMRNWVLGVKDEHDKVVDGIKSKIKYGVEDRRQKEKERSEALQKAFEEEGLVPSRLQPFSGDGAQEFLDRMRARVPGTKLVLDDKGHNSAYEKYIRNNPEIGNLHVDADGNLTSDMPVTEEMLEVLTKPKESQSLQDKVATRRPTLHYGEEEGKEE
jgi:hypothetical protein